MQMQSQFGRVPLRDIDPDNAMREALARALENAAGRHGFGLGAAQALWRALTLGEGAMAQFDHAEFGGHGQWMRGGMLMIGDMFNAALRVRVAALCEDLSRLYSAHPEWRAATPPARGAAAGAWWPEGLHSPSSSGTQNGIGYAFFPAQRRLAIHRDGRVELYDTGDHLIGAVSQQQGGAAGLRFASQHGPIALESLRRVERVADRTTTGEEAKTAGAGAGAAVPAARPASLTHKDPLDTLERLAALHARGVLTDAEFMTKKAELLGRL